MLNYQRELEKSKREEKELQRKIEEQKRLEEESKRRLEEQKRLEEEAKRKEEEQKRLYEKALAEKKAEEAKRLEVERVKRELEQTKKREQERKRLEEEARRIAQEKERLRQEALKRAEEKKRLEKLAQERALAEQKRKDDERLAQELMKQQARDQTAMTPGKDVNIQPREDEDFGVQLQTIVYEPNEPMIFPDENYDRHMSWSTHTNVVGDSRWVKFHKNIKGEFFDDEFSATDKKSLFGLQRCEDNYDKSKM